METKLLPCPFCGGEAELYSGGIKYVLCKDCLATSNDFKTEAEAIKTWNTRHDSTCEGCKYHTHPSDFWCVECSRYYCDFYTPKEDTDAD